jgi:hypothetical protein
LETLALAGAGKGDAAFTTACFSSLAPPEAMEPHGTPNMMIIHWVVDGFWGTLFSSKPNIFFWAMSKNEKYLPEANSSIILQRPCSKLPISSRIQNETR